MTDDIKIIDESEPTPIDPTLFLTSMSLAKGPRELPSIPREEVRARSYEFLRASFDPETAGVVTHTALLFRNPAHFGLALGEIVRNIAHAYADAGFTLADRVIHRDTIADMIYAEIAEHAFTADRTIHGVVDDAEGAA